MADQLLEGAVTATSSAAADLTPTYKTESGGLVVIDGENAGSTPWEFTSITNNGSATFALDAAAKRRGDYGYKFTADTGTTNGAYGTKSFTGVDEAYIRFFIYIPSATSMGGAAGENICVYRSNPDNYYLSFKIRYDNGTATQWGWQYHYSSYASSTNFSTNTWHRIEIRHKKHASVGGFEIWVDGTKIASDLDNNEDIQASQVLLGGIDSSNTMSGSLYFDDLKVDTQYIGEFGSVNMAGSAAASSSASGVLGGIYISTIKSTGGDYTHLSSWEAAKQGDLAANGIIERAVCYAFEDDNDGATLIEGSTTSVSCYMDITVDSSARHAGVWDDAKYHLEGWGAFYPNDSYTRVTGLQFTNYRDDYVARIGNSNVTGVVIDSCIFKVWSGSSQHAFTQLGTNTGCEYRNSIFIGRGLATGIDNNCWASGYCYIKNCTVVNFSTGIYCSSYSDATIKNTYSGGNTTTDYDKYSTATITYTTCASSDAVSRSGVTPSIPYSTATFQGVTAGSENLHLTATSALLRVGTNLATDFTTDIDGDTWGGVWDIGADYYSSVVTFTKTVKASLGDYTTVTAWETGRQKDLPSYNCIEEADVYAAGNVGKAILDGWTTGSTQYISIKCNSSVYHNGVWDEVNKPYMQPGGGEGSVYTFENYVRCDGMQWNYSASNNSYGFISDTLANGANEIRISRCLYRGHGDGSSRDDCAIYCYGNANLKVWNSIFYNINTSETAYVIGVYINAANGSLSVYSTTVNGGYYGFRQVNGPMVLKNCYAGGASHYDYLAEGANMTKVNCASADLTADDTGAGVTATNCITGVPFSTATFVNVTAGSQNLHLVIGSGLRRVGTKTTGDAAPMNFTTDIDGTTIGNVWDIGADYYGPLVNTKTVKSADGDYSSLSGWEAGREGDLVTLDYIEVAVCYAFEDTTACVIDGFTTSASNYMSITVDSSARHAGVWDAAKYRLNITDANCIYVLDDHTRIDGLQIGLVAPTDHNRNGIRYGGQSSTNSHRVSNCIIKGAGHATYRANGIYTEDTDTILNVWNCIVYEIHGSAQYGDCIYFEGASLNVYSCTLHAGTGRHAIFRVAGTVVAKNCYGSGDDVAYAGTITMTTCASSDTSGSPGLQNIPCSTANFVNVSAGSENFHLVAGSALLRVGTQTSGDAAPMNFTTDIDGSVRYGSWDIGADQNTVYFLVGAASGITVISGSLDVTEGGGVEQFCEGSGLAVSSSGALLNALWLLPPKRKTLAEHLGL